MPYHDGHARVRHHRCQPSSIRKKALCEWICEEQMKATIVTGPGQTDVVDVADPEVKPADVLVKIKACGICGSDALYISMGGLPPHQGGRMALGHEPAGEVVEVGRDVTGINVGDHVVINPIGAPSGIIGNGGATGGAGRVPPRRERRAWPEPRGDPGRDSVRGRRPQRTDGGRPARGGQSDQAHTCGQGRRVRRRADRARRDHRLQGSRRQPCDGGGFDRLTVGEGADRRRRRGNQCR